MGIMNLFQPLVPLDAQQPDLLWAKLFERIDVEGRTKDDLVQVAISEPPGVRCIPKLLIGSQCPIQI
jgi:hypothetical protein